MPKYCIKRSIVKARIQRLQESHSDDYEKLDVETATDEQLEEKFCLSGLFQQHMDNLELELDENDLVIIS